MSVLKDKIRWNVLYLATVAGAMTFYFGVKLLGMDDLPAGEILSLLVGMGIGSIMTIAGGLAQDAPPPAVPAAVHERMMNKAMDSK